MLRKYQPWTRRQTLWLITGTASSLVLHACSQPNQNVNTGSAKASSGKLMNASMGIATWIGFTPLLIAQRKGFFKELGLNFDAKNFSSGQANDAAYISGRIDGQGSVTSSAVAMKANKKNLRIVLVEDTSRGADGILARNSITDIKDFKGKTIAVEQQGVSHFFLLQVLEKEGLRESDVKLVNISPDEAAAAYQTGKVEIAVTYSPFLNQANSAIRDGRIIFDSSKMPTAIADLYTFDADFIDKNPETVEAFVRGIFKGLDFLKTNREEGLAIAAKSLGITPKELTEQLAGIQLVDLPTNIEMLSNPQSELYILKPMDALAKFLKDQGKIKEKPDLVKVIEPKFAKAVPATA